MTHAKFNTGFSGCIKNIFFKDSGIDFQGDAIRGWNVLPCDSDEAEPWKGILEKLVAVRKEH